MNIFYQISDVVGQRLSGTIWAMLVACFLPFVWTILAKWLGGFKTDDNHNPRAFLATLKGLPARANAVQANSFETLPMFLAGVLLAMHAFVPQAVINGLAWLYVFIRLGYGMAYLGDLPTLRSILWALSMACIFALFGLSLRVMG